MGLGLSRALKATRFQSKERIAVVRATRMFAKCVAVRFEQFFIAKVANIFGSLFLAVKFKR
jgi:hypothetical protein